MLFNLLSLSAALLLHGSPVAAQRAGAGTPCQSVSSMSAAFSSLYPSATIALVPAQVAENCLRSVPINKAEDLALLEEMKYYINWQSNLAYLADPPKGYQSDRVDVLDELARITNDLKNDKYKDEYTLMTDIQTVIVKSYDFHFVFTPDIARVFQFRRGNIGRGLGDEFAIVSVSRDGKELPQLYNYYDIMLSAKEGWTPSPITQINNQTADDYVKKWASNFIYLEDHARYNILFPSQPGMSRGSRSSQFGRSFRPDGDYTTVKHANDSIFQYINNAIIQKGAFDDVKDGQSFFDTFCNQGPPQPQGSRKRDVKRNLMQEIRDSVRNPVKAKRQANAKPTPTGYPAPVIYHPEGVLGGYYLTDQGYTDVAVLSVPSFSPDSTASGPLDFQKVVGAFLQDAVKMNKKKLVIDLRGNGGGFVYLGYDMFKQLFPSEDPYGASQFRANEAFNGVGQALSDIFDKEGITMDVALADFKKNGAKSTTAGVYASIFNWRVPNTITNKNFTSWADFFGPQTRHNDKFTTLSRKDLNNPFCDGVGSDVTGYGQRINALSTKQPFDAANIVLLQDGGCGSTCAVFSEFMKSQGNVQQIVVGGTPKTGPMQGVAGSKGSQVYTWAEVHNEASTVYEYMPERQAAFNKTELGALVYAQRPLMRTSYSDTGKAQSVINLRDNIRMNDADVTPLEFVYEAADCRLFYTPDMVRDVRNVWKKTVDVQWGNAKDMCVQGSTKHPSSLSGGATPKKGNQPLTAEGKAGRVGVSGGLVMGVVGLLALVMG